MIKIVFRIVIKKEKEEEFKEVLKKLTESAHTEPDRCIRYTFYQSLVNPRDFILHEEWENQDKLDTHLERLKDMFGQPSEGSILPAKLNDFFEDTEDILYKN